MSEPNVLSFSHERAERLIDDRLDAERGEAELPKSDAAWLDEHLASCERCREVEQQRRRMLAAMRGLRGTEAPGGFAERVLQAAAVERHEQAAGVDDAPADPKPGGFSAPFWVGGAIAAAIAAVFVVGTTTMIGTKPPAAPAPAGGVGALGSGLESVAARPHFVVRAPGLGAAKARSHAVAIVEAHGGVYEVSGNAVIARVPRAHLVAIMKDLSKRSRYKVSKSDAGELDPALTEVIIEFELE